MPLAIASRQFGLGNFRAETWFQEPIGRGSVRVSMRAVFLNQRDLLIMRGARPAAGFRWVGDGGSGLRQGGRRPYCGEFGLRVGRPRLRKYGTDFVVDRCQHSCGAAVRGRSGDGGRCGAGCWRHAKASVLSRAVRDGASSRVMLLQVDFTDIICRTTGRAARQPCPVRGPD